MKEHRAKAHSLDIDPEPIDTPAAIAPCLAGGGETGARLRAHDWRASPLGPPERWPDALATAVALCLNSPQPSAVWWGPDFVLVHNDTAQAMLDAGRRRATLARPGRDALGQAWPLVEPQLRGVVVGGTGSAHDLRIASDRGIDSGDVAVTLHAGPIKHADGRIGGVFTTFSVVAAATSCEDVRQSREDLLRLNETLENRVAERIQDLAAANRQLLAQIEAREKVESTLRQMQRLDAVGQLTSGVAHDFNNLLTVILGNISYLEKTWSEADDPKLMRRITHVRIAAERGAKLVAQLLAFSRQQRLEPRTLDLGETVSRMHELLNTTMGGGVQIETVSAEGLWPALVDPTQLELVVLNLAINARDAMQVGGRLSVTTANVRLGEPARTEMPVAGDYVELAVCDNGAGMAPDVLAKAFEPFFTTKIVGKGSGLGLSQVLGFAKQSGGGVKIESEVGCGTTVRVYFPRAPIGVASDGTGALEAMQGQGKAAVVLIVDDDDEVRNVTVSMLEGLGHKAIEAGSGGAALERLAERDDIAIALIDFAMPGMSGVDLAREARMRRPALPIVFITGYADTTVLAGIRHEHILRKPFLETDLDRRIRAALSNKHAGSLDELMAKQ